MNSKIKRIPAAFLVTAAVVFSQCMGSQIQTSDPRAYFENAEFVEDMSTSRNPERGWYRSMETQDADMGNLEEFAEDNITLVALEAYIGDFLTGPIDAAKLNEIDTAFSNARKAGLSVIFRAAYDFEGEGYEKNIHLEPTDIQIVLNHISQLGPIFKKHEDILFSIQAGFFGPWGEWHSSRYSPGGKQDESVEPQYQRMLVDALLENSGSSTFIAVRRPEYVRNVTRGEALTPGNAFNGERASRVSFHNDALMSDSTDMDTYIDPDYPKEDEFKWINNLTRYTPFIGETNLVSRNNDVPKAIPFLELMNATSLNFEYHPKVLNKWKTGRYEGENAYDRITRMLGYRFVLKEAALGGNFQPGGELTVNLQLANTGFGYLLREKKFQIVLKRGDSEFRAEINDDPRFWTKQELLERDYRFQLPSGISEGNFDVYLGLTSTFDSLARNPAYSVRFANLDIWDADLGLNKIGSITVSGPGNGEIKEFAQIR